ncbi:helix-turn-helix domain-containing protein [Hoeflea prorocentri]|uniref:Helix-turn-helix domain-containing protein n=1 Tax=Hoeflea prorocentri TaxID=1922333 RepID=A0A9X3ZHN4_9HYPH|nr:helix-turn-helix domain-containing protein [Hoeflea prorocentri]MCY6380910.1 helix-turn-helix domain-containing protein [Hoeflea prorocentri]MDA5398710.1 helix-turn-helix domain-containing protein [Hoeflea prorocentri]
MMAAADLIVAPPDYDTLGGRISRARDALDLTSSQLARRLGVKTETVQAWETDRSEPRANRVTMLAGVLGVSPTWLLNGIGESPAVHVVNSELKVLSEQLSKLKRAHAAMGLMIDSIAAETERVSRQIEK